MLRLRSFSMAFILVILATATALAQDAAKPVALVGSSYGTYEINAIIKHALAVSKEQEYCFEKLGTKLPVADLDKYSLVIIATALSERLTDEEKSQLDTYVSEGGHLLIISNPTDFRNRPCFGMESISWHRKGADCKALKPNHPLLKGVFDKYEKPKWLRGAIMARVKPNGMVNLIGTANGSCLVGQYRLGKGWVVFMGHELFRLKPHSNRDVAGWIQILRNIIAAVKPPTTAMRRSQAREQAFRSHELQGRKLLVWQREGTNREHNGKPFSLPMPPQAKELITALSVDMAVDRYGAVQLNLTPLVDVGHVSWKIVPGKFPRANVEFFVQDRPDPIPWPKKPEIAVKAPHWFLPPEQVAPEGQPEFTVPVKQTRIVWLRLNTIGVAPGDYELTLKLNFAKGSELSVPIKVKVSYVVFTVRESGNRRDGRVEVL